GRSPPAFDDAVAGDAEDVDRSPGGEPAAERQAEEAAGGRPLEADAGDHAVPRRGHVVRGEPQPRKGRAGTEQGPGEAVARGRRSRGRCVVDEVWGDDGVEGGGVAGLDDAVGRVVEGGDGGRRRAAGGDNDRSGGQVDRLRHGGAGGEGKKDGD